MNDNRIYKRDLKYEKIDEDSIILYDNENEEIHVLNGTAFFIWMNSNGKFIDEIIENFIGELVGKYTKNEIHTIKEDCKNILKDMLAKNLIYTQGGKI